MHAHMTTVTVRSVHFTYSSQEIFLSMPLHFFNTQALKRFQSARCPPTRLKLKINKPKAGSINLIVKDRGEFFILDGY